ncbi:unnamed protein product, partial [Prunus brigantina]
ERQKAVVVGLFSETVGSMWKTEVGLDEKGLSYRGAFVLFVVWINETLCPDPEPKAQSGLVTSPSFMKIYHYALTSLNMVSSTCHRLIVASVLVSLLSSPYNIKHGMGNGRFISHVCLSLESSTFMSSGFSNSYAGETSSAGHNWLDLQGGIVVDGLIQGGATMEPVEPTVLAELTDWIETHALANTTALAESEHASFTDDTEPISPPTSQIVPDQAPLDIPKVRISIST